MYDSIIIGSGLAGSVVARELAEKANHNVLIIEKRNHLGGNCFDKVDDQGILIHPYGPHIFHTHNKAVFDYLSKFTQWHLFNHQVVASVAHKLIPVPFNLNSLYQVYPEELANRMKEKLINDYGMGSKIPILTLNRNKDSEIRQLAKDVYQLIYLGYTQKQWGLTPEEVDSSVTGRVPVHISYDNSYFQDPYQGVPKQGYTKMLEQILDHPNIEIQFEVDARELLSIKNQQVFFSGEAFMGNIIYTAPIDELLDYRHGHLPYRSLDFCFEHHNVPDYQGYGVVNYTMSEAFTRITEFKHLTGQVALNTTIVKEYPCAYLDDQRQLPYYPILTDQNRAIYKKYQTDISDVNKFYLLGRLAEYQYFNMDVIVERALNLSQSMIEEAKRK